MKINQGFVLLIIAIIGILVSEIYKLESDVIFYILLGVSFFRFNDYWEIFKK